MLVHHASPLSSSRDNITKVRHADEDGRKVHAHEGPQQAQQFITNEQGEHEEKKMSVNCLLNNPVDEIRTSSSSILRNSKEIGRSTDSISREIKPERSGYDDQYIEYIEGSPPTTPTVSTPTPQRAPCSVCKNETGRCHASDPSTMQSFFASTLGFEGILNVSDWLCMKCYSKWYNRCKRKATSALAMTVVDPSVPLPQQKRKRREKDKDGNVHKADGEKSLKDSDRDTDSDDALLLARIGGNFPSSALNSSGSVPTEDGSDLDGASVEDLRAEVGRLKQEMRKLVTDLSQRDEQIENMMKFVKTEVAGMHDLLKEIYNAKYSSSATSSAAQHGAQGAQAPLHHLPPSNHPISIPSIPALFPVPLLGKDHS